MKTPENDRANFAARRLYDAARSLRSAADCLTEIGLHQTAQHLVDERVALARQFRHAAVSGGWNLSQIEAAIEEIL